MRLSVDRRDPGWDQAMDLGIDLSCILVTVDGDCYRNLVTVDVDKGIIWVIALDDHGQPHRNRWGVLPRLIRGRVTVRFLARPDGSWPHEGVDRPAEPVRVSSWRKKA